MIVERRAKDTSSSPLGQWVHDKLKRDFDAVDVDLEHFAVSTNVLRSFESKRPGQALKPSQWRGLPRRAWWVDRDVREGRLAPGSGVFVVWFDHEQEMVTEMRRVLPHATERRLSGPLFPGTIPVELLAGFFRCRDPLPSAGDVAANLVPGDVRPSTGICSTVGCGHEAKYGPVCGLCDYRASRGSRA